MLWLPWKPVLLWYVEGKRVRTKKTLTFPFKKECTPVIKETAVADIVIRSLRGFIIPAQRQHTDV